MKHESHDEWTDQLSAYMEEELTASARERLEEHLSLCVHCRDVLEELRAVVTLARAAEELEPPADLWSAVDASIRAGKAVEPSADEDVIVLPTARTRPVTVGASGPRLAAAAAVLVMISVGSTWWVARAGVPGPSAVVVDEATPAGEVLPAAGYIPQDLAAQLGALEGVVDAARATLDPTTVEVLERNLRTIQSAIDDSALALAADPNNAFLMEHLQRMYRRKLTYLQDAVRVAEWAS